MPPPNGFTLAEGATHAVLSNNRRKTAFTLAEVLITLGIIGVVAVLTIPSLIQNHRKHIVETKLAKFYSTINQTINMAETNYGSKSDWQINNVDDFFAKYIKPNIKYIKTEEIYQDTNKIIAVYLPDGSAFTIDIYTDFWGIITNGGHFIYFPNAKNLTKEIIEDYSKTGKDWFLFAFWPSNTDDIYKYHRNKGVEPYLANWNGDPETLQNGSLFSCSKNSDRPVYCTAVIQRNGWKIPKDYPIKF